MFSIAPTRTLSNRMGIFGCDFYGRQFYFIGYNCCFIYCIVCIHLANAKTNTARRLWLWIRNSVNFCFLFIHFASGHTIFDNNSMEIFLLFLFTDFCLWFWLTQHAGLQLLRWKCLCFSAMKYQVLAMDNGHIFYCPKLNISFYWSYFFTFVYINNIWMMQLT